MKAVRILLILLLLLIVLPVAALGIFLATFDANAYRTQVADALTQRLGRTVTLAGPLQLGVSWRHGIKLDANDVSFANPAWASRPLLAKIGHMELGVRVPPLLQRSVEVSAFTLEDADVQLETNAQGQTNWDLRPAVEKKPAAPQPEAKAEGKMPVALHVDEVQVKNSRLGVRDKDGKVTRLAVQDLTLITKGQGTELHFTGDVAETPVRLNVTGGAVEAIMDKPWPFRADGTYDAYDFQAEGTLNQSAKTAELARYRIAAGGSALAGALNATWGGARPAVRGNVKSDRLDPTDFGGPETAAPVAPTANNAPAGEKKLFSTEPLKLEGLKAADAKLDIGLGELVMGRSTLRNVQAKLDLTNGRLLLSPVSADFAGSRVEGQIKLDASLKPPALSTTMNAHQLELSELAQFGGLESFIAGKGDMEVDVTSSGNSAHDLASNANGRFSLIAAGGSLSSQALGKIAGSLLEALAPGTGQLARPEMNCLAARFNIVNGVAQSNGILVDTGTATIAGGGNINLRNETIDMLLRTRTKAFDVGRYAPPLHIAGPLTGPSFRPDAAASVEKLAGLFLGGGAASESGVPDLVEQNGHNACVNTLDRPQAAKPANGALQDGVGKAREKLKGMGDELLKGLGGGLFGK